MLNLFFTKYVDLQQQFTKKGVHFLYILCCGLLIRFMSTWYFPDYSINNRRISKLAVSGEQFSLAKMDCYPRN